MLVQKISLEHLACHPEITELYALSLTATLNENNELLSDEAIIFMQKNTPLHVVKLDDKLYGFFSNWEALTALKNRGIKNVAVIIHNHVTPDEIQNWAYLSVITKGAYPSQEKAQLKYLHQVLKQSRNLWRRIFKAEKPRTASSAIQQLTRLTRSQVRTKLNNQAQEVSELEQFLGGKDGS